MIISTLSYTAYLAIFLVSFQFVDVKTLLWISDTYKFSVLWQLQMQFRTGMDIGTFS